MARDDRLSGVDLAARVVASATGRGADLVDFDVASTPTAKAAARALGLDGAIIVTGSHLAPDWNGLKLIAAPDWMPVDVRELREASSRPARRGSVKVETGAARLHAAAICAAVDVERIRDARLKVTCSGGAGPVADLLLDELGCRRDRPEVALRLDPDGDRLQLADERGVPLDTEVLLPFVAQAREARVVVRSTDTSHMIDRLVAEKGGLVHASPPGELHVARAVAALEADLAGEGNGGVILPAAGPYRDGLAAAACVLELLATTGRPLSALAAALPRLFRRRSSVACPDAEIAHARLEAVAASFGRTLGLAHEGVLVERATAWGLVRQSATEPVIRVTSEATTEEEAVSVHDELRKAVEGA